MHADLLTTGEFISANDVVARGEITAVLERVRVDKLDPIDPEKKKRKIKQAKGLLKFVGIDREWVMNVTNKELLKRLFGDGRCGKCRDEKCTQTDHWLGHKITLGRGTQLNAGATVDAIIVAGSPELTAPVRVMVQLRGKRAREFVLRPTTAKGATAPMNEPATTEPAEPTEPAIDPSAPACTGNHPEPVCASGGCYLRGPSQ